jgi:hypothetical protein
MSDAVTLKIESLGDWRGERLARIRRIIMDVDPGMTEDVKWRKAANPLGVPTWSYAGVICTGETYRGKVKLTFSKGAMLGDGHGLFNASLEGARRAVDLGETDVLDASALTVLVREAMAVNLGSGKPS